MKKIFIVFFYLCFFFNNLKASEVINIINNFNEIENLSFSFKQNINDKEEKGNCIIEYPKKIYCLYENNNEKLLVSDGKSLVIKNQRINQYYIYPIEKTALNLILDKNFLISKIKETNVDLIDDKFYRFKFDESENSVNIFFDKKTLNIIGWQNIDIYQNLVITYLFDLKINLPLKKDQFKLPSIN
ncbi:MAG: outer-membrane lipoprotein carrier protein LolA [Candidatus Pelagibacter sp.]|jgi:outer membrane lipoprotein-sorting protein|tara:strand:+ start:738 stop:1295 length:558 start_codon:yes stop_codon:yes gene_type:complete